MAKLSVAKSLTEAKKLTKSGKVEDAKRVYENILETFPGNKRAKEGLALLGKTNPVSESQPTQSEIEILIALYNQGLFSEVISKSNSLLKLHPGSVTLWNIIGASCLGIGHADQAEASFRRILDLDPGSSDGWYNLGVSLEKQNKPHEAIRAYKEAIRLDSSYVNAYNNLGLNYKNLGNFKEALAAYDKALEINPKYAEVHYNKGLVFQLDGQLQEALLANLEALSHKPNYVDAYLNIGSIYRTLAEYDKAVSFYKTAISLQPGFTEAYNNLGNTLGDMGKYEDAETILSAGMKIDPNNADIHNNLANILKSQGKLSAAIDAYERAIDLNPNQADYCLNLANILAIVESPKSTKNLITQCHKQIQNSKFNFNQLLTDNQSLNQFLNEIYDIIDFYKIDLETKESQIFRRNTEKFSCSRHMEIFNEYKIIPKSCFSCFKVQISVNSFLDLVRVYLIFDKVKLDRNNSRKCMIETRPYVDGFFKGLIYCNSLSEAENISYTLNNGFLLDLNQNYKATIKRGCSEYPLAYPKYTVPTKVEPGMVYDENWVKIETEFDAKTLKAKETKEFETVSGLSLIDFIILKNWGKYALGLGDQNFDGNYFGCEAENYFYTQGLARKQLYKKASY